MTFPGIPGFPDAWSPCRCQPHPMAFNLFKKSTIKDEKGIHYSKFQKLSKVFNSETRYNMPGEVKSCVMQMFIVSFKGILVNRLSTSKDAMKN